MTSRLFARVAGPVVLALVFAPTGSAAFELPIPRSQPGDKGVYFLMEFQRNGHFVTTLHRRHGPSGTGYSRTEINCASMRIRDLGYSEEGPSKMKMSTGPWYKLVPGSSKSDLARFACGLAKR